MKTISVPKVSQRSVQWIMTAAVLLLLLLLLSGDLKAQPVHESVAASPELIIDAGGFLGPVGDLAVSPDSRTIAATGDKVVRIIDVSSGTVIRTLRGDRLRTAYGNTNAVAFSPDGQFLIVGVHDYGAHGSIRVYRTSALDEIDQLIPGHNSPCLHAEFSRDGRHLVTVDGDGHQILWDWPSRKIVKRIRARNPEKPIIDSLQMPVAEPMVLSVQHDGPHLYGIPDGRKLSASDPMPANLLGWMFDVKSKLVDWPFGTTLPARVYEMRLEQGFWLAAGMGTENGASRPWVAKFPAREFSRQAPTSPARLKPTVVYSGHQWEVYAIAASPDRQFIVSGDKFGEVHIWNAQTGQRIHRISGQGKPVYEARFSEGNDRIVFGTDADLRNWNFNRYGRVSGVLDLKQRTIRKEESARGTIDESPILDGRTVSIQSPAAGEQSYLVKLGGSGAGTNYRIPSGRIPSCYTLLAGEKLGVRNPVLFSDNLGFLAMWDSSGDELRRVFGGHESMITSISPSSSGQIFVTGSTDRTIRIWSLLNHRKSGIFDFKYENSSVIRVIPGSSSEEAGVRVGDRIVSVDGHTLDEIYEMMLYGRYTYQPDQLVPVIMGRGEQTLSYQMKLVEGFDYIDPLLNVFVGDQGQWIIWTPRGYFDCSPGADQLIGWHVNRGPAKSAEFFRVQQFRKSLYRPDIIDRIIELGDVDAAEHQADSARKLGKVVNLPDQKEFQAHRPPVVRIESPAPDSSPKDARITVVAKASSENELPISRVTLLHNGTPARVFRPANPAEGKSLNISHRLTLFPGKNEISLIAENSSATSSADDCRIVLQSQATAEKSRVFVLSIGISSYLQHGKGLENLRFAADDARAFAAAVEQQSHGRIYEAVQTKLLLDDAARRTDFLEGLQWLVDQVKPGDVVMLFFSGHGFLDDGSNFYFSTHEVEPEKLRSTGVSWREVIGILHEELPACKRLVFLDACHADGIAVSGTQSPLHDMAAPEMGTIFYASCTLQQKSFEREEWRHGAFTKAILDVLGDTAADVFPRTGDGLISTTELSLGVTDRVSTMTGNQQNPVVYSPDRLKLLNILELKN